MKRVAVITSSDKGYRGERLRSRYDFHRMSKQTGKLLCCLLFFRCNCITYIRSSLYLLFQLSDHTIE